MVTAWHLIVLAAFLVAVWFAARLGMILAVILFALYERLTYPRRRR